MTDIPNHGEWMQTYSGLAFDYRSPLTAQVSPVDIAHALAHLNRFCGHLDAPMSVARHSILVADIVRICFPQAPSYAFRQALVHDAPEAYIADIPAPLKRMLPDYQQVEQRVWEVCALRFEVPLELDTAVKEADWLACRLEAWTGFTKEPLADWAGRNETGIVPDSVLDLLIVDEAPDYWKAEWLRLVGA